MMRAVIGSPTPDPHVFVAHSCRSCGRIHLINRATGRLLSEALRPETLDQAGWRTAQARATSP